MAATVEWYEDNGTATGNPAKGATRTKTGGDGSKSDFTSVDSPTASRNTNRIIAGQNSYIKYRFVRFSGTFNEVSAGKFAHTAGAFGTGISLKAKVTSTYETPSRTVLAGGSDITQADDINNGLPVRFSTVGPEGSASSSINSPGYSQYIAMQLQTTSSASAGDTGDKTLVFQWNEN